MKKISLLLLLCAALSAGAAGKKIVFVAGNPSHGPGAHEHRAGCLLLKSCLDKVPGVTSVVVSNGWPKEVSAFDGADAVVIYCDGGNGHTAIQQERLESFKELTKKGVGIGCLHYAVEVPKEKAGAEFLSALGQKVYLVLAWYVAKDLCKLPGQGRNAHQKSVSPVWQLVQRARSAFF